MTAQPKPALSFSRVEEVDALVAIGFTAFSDEALNCLDTLIEMALRHQAKDNGGIAILPPGASAVVVSVKAGAQRWRSKTGSSATALVATRKDREQAAPALELLRDGHEEHLSSAHAAAWWGVSSAHVRHLASTGQLAARRGPRGAWQLERLFVTSHRTVAAAVAAHHVNSQASEAAA